MEIDRLESDEWLIHMRSICMIFSGYISRLIWVLFHWKEIRLSWFRRLSRQSRISDVIGSNLKTPVFFFFFLPIRIQIPKFRFIFDVYVTKCNTSELKAAQHHQPTVVCLIYKSFLISQTSSLFTSLRSRCDATSTTTTTTEFKWQKKFLTAYNVIVSHPSCKYAMWFLRCWWRRRLAGLPLTATTNLQ